MKGGEVIRVDAELPDPAEEAVERVCALVMEHIAPYEGFSFHPVYVTDSVREPMRAFLAALPPRAGLTAWLLETTRDGKTRYWRGTKFSDNDWTTDPNNTVKFADAISAGLALAMYARAVQRESGSRVRQSLIAAIHIREHEWPDALRPAPTPDIDAAVREETERCAKVLLGEMDTLPDPEDRTEIGHARARVLTRILESIRSTKEPR